MTDGTSLKIQSVSTVAPARGDGNGLFSSVERMEFLNRDGAATTRTLALGAEALRIAHVTSTGHRIALREDSSVTLLLPQVGTLEVEFEGRIMRANEGGALILARGSRITTVLPGSSGRFQALVAMLPAADLAIRSESCDPGCDPESRELDRGLARHLNRALGVALPALRERSSGGGQGVRAPLWSRMTEDLLEILQLGLFHKRVGYENGTAASAGWVRSAIQIMHDDADERQSIAVIADRLGIGVRNLQLAFQRHLGMPPSELLTEIRLREARRRLRRPQETEGVTEIALDCGFTHLSRFSLTYQRKFGEKPSETLRRAR